MYFRRKTSAGRAYLQIVESRRDGDQVRQQVTHGTFSILWLVCNMRASTAGSQCRRQPCLNLPMTGFLLTPPETARSTNPVRSSYARAFKRLAGRTAGRHVVQRGISFRRRMMICKSPKPVRR